MAAYERALNANRNSIPALNAIGMLLKGREAFEKALGFFSAITQLDGNNGEAWGNLGKSPCLKSESPELTCVKGHCYLMTEDLQKAYDAYQQALVNLRDPKVSPVTNIILEAAADRHSGPYALVWHRHPL